MRYNSAKHANKDKEKKKRNQIKPAQQHQNRIPAMPLYGGPPKAVEGSISSHCPRV